MKIGVFDSGLGGLLIAKSIREVLPAHDLLYLGDTLHLPYGRRSREVIYRYTKNAIEFLFSQNCRLVIVACNTASALALRRLQQEYLPASSYPERRVLGVVVPTLEVMVQKGYQKIGLIGTEGVVHSGTYQQELAKLDSSIELIEQATPLLTPMLEYGGHKWIGSVIEEYLQPLIKENVEAIVLGCTHYSFLKEDVQRYAGDNIDIISQNEIIPYRLRDYLERHNEIEKDLSKQGKTDFLVTDITTGYIEMSRRVYGSPIALKKVDIELNDSYSVAV